MGSERSIAYSNTTGFNLHPLMARRLFLIAVIAKALGILFSNDFESSFARILNLEWEKQVNTILSVNPDELLIAEAALNYVDGKGYVSSMEIIRPGHHYNETSLRPSYPVFFHVMAMRIYHFFVSDRIEVRADHHYFKLYASGLHLISTILFGFSTISFYRICSYFFSNQLDRTICIGAYLFYPSIFHFVGNLACYESVALSLFLITFHGLLKLIRSPTTRKDIFVFGFCGVLATLIRPQLLIIFAFVFISFKVYLMLTQKNPVAFHRFLLIFIVSFALVSIPVFIKNYKTVGLATLSTQSGFSLFEGHNPYARGSWCGDCQINPEQPTYQYIRKEIPGFDSLSEAERSNGLKKMAIQWAMHNPLNEIILSIRKAAIYFLPYNSEDNSFNLVTFLVHALALLFFAMIGYRLFKPNAIELKNFLIIGPLVGSLALSIIFFVGYRWRYFAEPFMIIMSIMVIREILFSFKMNFK